MWTGTVVPIPGPSAVLAAIVASGVAGPRWSFEGFLPRRGRERRARLARIAADERGCVVYEAPGRVAATLGDLAAACGADRPGAVCRELTKVHEEIVRGPLGELADAAGSGRLTLRGEVSLVVGERRGGAVTLAPGPAAAPSAAYATGAASSTADAGVELLAARAEVDRLVAAGTPRGEATRRVAAATGLPRRRLYAVPRNSD
jgi:16S rRNA (cytidine1402-2'-O)-methyltransferase